MKDIILITGANGHLAKSLRKLLSKDYKIRYLTTKKVLTTKASYFYWDIEEEYIDTKALENCKHIIHLAGYPILKRWTRKNKKIIYDSRIKSTNILLDKCKLLNIKVETFICASAIGIYDISSAGNINEDALKGNDWIAQMACDWEYAANKFKELGSRVVQMRISLIFSKNAGFLKYNLLSMKYGIGLIIGRSNRRINWIHVHDIVRFILESIKNKNYSGPYNLASDDAISQRNLIKLIKNKLFPYSIVIKIPMYLVRLFLGKRSQIISADLSLNTNKLKESGFKYKFNQISEVIDNLK